MTIAPATYISDLDPTKPDGAAEPISSGDDYLRRLHAVLRNTFPNVRGAVLASHTELNSLVGAQPLEDRFLGKTPPLPASFMATVAEAEDGLDTTKVMAPATTFAAIDKKVGVDVRLVPQQGVLPASAPDGSLVYVTTEQRMYYRRGGAWRWLALGKERFENEMVMGSGSGEQSFAINHGLGGLPAYFGATLVCKTAENGWAVGDEVDAASGRTSDGSVCCTVWANGSQIGVVMKTRPYLLQRVSPYAAIQVSAANWRLKVWAER